MIRQHSNCKIDRCEVCLKDHEALEQHLWQIIGTRNDKVDILSRYRNYLDEREIKSEGEDGWGNEHAFNDKNIFDFCYHYNWEDSKDA